MTLEWDAVLLVGFGGPTKFEEVRPFILNVVRGRPVSAERIEQVVDQYRIIGGRSPFNEWTDRQARALELLLIEGGQPVPVFVGMLYWQPYIGDVVDRIASSGARRLLCIVMAPHRCEVSFDRYVSAVGEAIGGAGVAPPAVKFAPPWYDHPLFVEAVCERVKDAIETVPERERAALELVFTAHSIPLSVGDAAQYAGQFERTASLVAEKLGMERWRLAYQSKGGAPGQRWLEPDIRDVIAEVAGAAVRRLVVVPVGFLCDHAEVLYDLDVQARQCAKELGVQLLRAATVGDHPAFIRLLAELVKARVPSNPC